VNREHWVNSSFAQILKILHEPFSALLDIQEDYVELEVVQRRTKKSDQKYSMALYVGIAVGDRQLELGGPSMNSCTAERGSAGMSCWCLLRIQELGPIKQS